MHIHGMFQTWDISCFLASPEKPMVPKDLPKAFLKLRIWAVKIPHPPTEAAAAWLVQKPPAAGLAVDVKAFVVPRPLLSIYVLRPLATTMRPV